MPMVVRSDVHYNVRKYRAICVLPERTSTGLDRAERQALSEWLDTAAGIDTAMDLGVRPWNIPGATAIIGVFETGSDQASWLVVRCDQGWMLARRTDGYISDVFASLQDILDLIDEP